jgi:hypothetical protein
MRIDIIMCILCQISHQNIVNSQGISDITVLLDRHLIIFLGRNQRLLDLSRAEVQDYIIGQMSDLFSSANIAYVKWDMNRIVTDYYSKILPPERQGEVAHRYVLGLYRCMKELTERFPEILFEGCAAGGNRFDLGILSYFPQIWASDDTDALCRAEIQTGYSYGYPMSVVSAHVSSCPNHQTLRMTPLETRFQVTAIGMIVMDKRSPIREDAAIGSVTTASLFELIWNTNKTIEDINPAIPEASFTTNVCMEKRMASRCVSF